jgi:hypothetical protein
MEDTRMRCRVCVISHSIQRDQQPSILRGKSTCMHVTAWFHSTNCSYCSSLQRKTILHAVRQLHIGEMLQWKQLIGIHTIHMIMIHGMIHHGY